MENDDIIRNCLHYMMKAIYEKMVADGVENRKVITLGVYDDESLYRQRRVGWYTWIEIEGEPGEETLDYGAAVCLRQNQLKIAKVQVMGEAVMMTRKMELIFVDKAWDKIKVDEKFYELLKEENRAPLPVEKTHE